MYVWVLTTRYDLNDAQDPAVLVSNIPGQFIGKPPIQPEVNIHLPHSISSDVDTFISEGVSLAFSTTGFTSVSVSRT